MSSAAAGSETGPGTAHELPLKQPPLEQQQEVVVAPAELQAPAPAPVSVVVAAAQVPAPVSVVTIVISQPEEVAPEPKAVAQASPALLEVGDGSAMAALAAAKEAELARCDSFDEQCRYTVGAGFSCCYCETMDVWLDPVQEICELRTEEGIGKVCARVFSRFVWLLR
jgi:hypothetical protein